jgi:hypothetical protein
MKRPSEREFSQAEMTQVPQVGDVNGRSTMKVSPGALSTDGAPR